MSVAVNRQLFPAAAEADVRAETERWMHREKELNRYGREEAPLVVDDTAEQGEWRYFFLPDGTLTATREGHQLG